MARTSGVTTAMDGNQNLANPWDAYDAYMFDIDGTLLTCSDAVHYFAFCHVLQWLSGRPLTLEGITAHGNTDIGILRDTLRRANVPEECWRGRLTEVKALMGQHVQENKHDLRATALPGVKQLLHRLRSRGAVLGVATGNLEEIGRLKLEHCGLFSYFSFGGYSDAYEYRHDVFAGALKQARAAAGSEARICVVGDTPADVQAAHANDLDVIAVATGIYPFERLLEEKPEWCFRSLSGPPQAIPAPA